MTRAWLCVLLVACQPADRAAPAPELGPPVAPPPAVKPLPVPVRIAPTRGHVAVGSDACVRTATEGVACWGSSASPVVVAGLAHVAGVVSGQATVCAWTATGEVWCRGPGGAVAKVPGIDDAAELAVDPLGVTVCARRTTGRVACREPRTRSAPR